MSLECGGTKEVASRADLRVSAHSKTQFCAYARGHRTLTCADAKTQISPPTDCGSSGTDGLDLVGRDPSRSD
jgi:hypothetical protein